MTTLSDAIEAAAAPHIGPDKLPGLVAGVARGDERTVVALGTLDVDPGRPARRDSLFRLSSSTKPITAAAAMAMIDEGLMTLEEPVDRLLPELAFRTVLRSPDGPLDDTVPAERPITVHEVLNFTLGFGMATEMFMAAEPWPIMAAEAELALRTIGPPDPSIEVPEQNEWMERLGSLPLLAHPGERWLYNTGASVAGVLVARAAGQGLGEVLRTRLFEPLGMRDTAFFTPDVERLAGLYRPTPAGIELWDPPDGAWSRPPSFEDGAAGLVSSIDDELTFGQVLLRRGAIGGGRILSERTAVAMCSDQLTGAQRSRGGLGPGFFDDLSWGYCQAVQNDGSFGWAGGFGSTWLVDPARDLVVVVLSQVLFASSAGHPVHDAIQAAARAY